MTQLDLFAPPSLRVVFPERKCKDCPFADFNANGMHTYPLLMCHMPSYSIYSPGDGWTHECCATWWPEDSKSEWCNGMIRERLANPPARVLSEFDRKALEEKI